MSSRLLTDWSILRWDSVSTSMSRGETPSFSCSRAVMPEDPGHSSAGSVTDDDEEWSAAWGEVERIDLKQVFFSPLKSHECGFIDYLPEDFERPRPPCSHTLHQTQWNHLCLTEHTNTQFTLISFQQRERKLCIQTEKCNKKCDKKKIVQGSVRGEVRQALSMSHQNQKTDSYATDNNRAHDSLLLC